VAYLGPEATYTEQAALKNFGSSLSYCPLPSIPDVFSAVSHSDADYGVIPIENSTGGAVFHSLDMLAETELKIVAQVYLDIEHCLISRQPMAEIREVRSKDQALVQCRDWLRRHLPHARQIEVDSTAEAVRQAGQTPGVSAIASALAADRYGVPVLARGIQDMGGNVTRFLVIGDSCTAPACGGGKDRTSLVFSLKDEVGALETVLQAFASRGVNLMKIESRPNRKKAWDYLFFVDLVGHIEDPNVKAAVEALAERCPFVKWLGSYPNH
jgi:chorismate mutase/prephenate dehydratase